MATLLKTRWQLSARLHGNFHKIFQPWEVISQFFQEISLIWRFQYVTNLKKLIVEVNFLKETHDDLNKKFIRNLKAYTPAKNLNLSKHSTQMIKDILFEEIKDVIKFKQFILGKNKEIIILRKLKNFSIVIDKHQSFQKKIERSKNESLN